MIKYLILSVFIIGFNSSIAQTPDSGSFYLHKFAQNIGKETYKLTRNGNTNTYDINFKFVDRGSPVPLKAQLVLTTKGEPVSLVITRKTDQTCAKEIIIPDYGIKRELPLDKPVTIAFTPKKSGEIKYSCGIARH